MPRPKLKSDDEVLEAATVVLKRCGPIEFTLSGVAKEVGLSRSVNPALHQPRYAAGEDDGARRRAGAALPECDTDRRRAARALGIFAGARSEHEHSQRLLGELSHLLVRAPGAGATHACDPAEPRGGGGSASDCPSAPAAAELLLHSVIAGATMQWAVDPDGELADHVLAQIAAILCLMFPEHDDFQLLQAHA
nr:macrolide 2'-phosphotransferase [Escherichia coli]